MQLRRELVGDAGQLEDFDRELAHRRDVERAQRDARGVHRGIGAERGAERAGADVGRRPEGGDHRQLRRHRAGEEPHEVAGVLVGPLEVVDQHERRPARPQELPHRAEDAVAFGDRVGEGLGPGRKRFRELGEQRPQHAGDRAQRPERRVAHRARGGGEAGKCGALPGRARRGTVPAAAGRHR